MASYFRIFHTPITTMPEKVDKIVMASCILHNMMRDEKIPSPSELTFGDAVINLPTANFIPIANAIGRPSNNGSRIREKFKEYFNGSGAVSWQRGMIR